MSQPRRFRVGGWLPHDLGRIDLWIRDLKKRVDANPRPLIKPIREFQEMVYQDPVLHHNIFKMFQEAAARKKETPLGTPEIRSFEEFLALLNQIMWEAPEYTECEDKGKEEPCGLIGFPINALLNWPMGTDTGYDVFSNSLVNQALKKILAHWSTFLVTEESRYVLVENHPDRTPKVLAWLNPIALQEMVNVACQGQGDSKSCTDQKFEQIFKCDPADPYYGFKSWDHFFTRTFVKGVRPVASPDDDNVIVNACESGPLQKVEGVNESDTFWLKNMPYSLMNMMDFDPLASEFKNGTVYQAFLSALSYHRWHSPVAGTIKKAFVVNGTYYLENRYEGFIDPEGADPSAPNGSQPFLSSVATRAVIFIEADNPKIGLMCFVAIGMAEVSSCEITVSQGQHVPKGDQLGMFHFGGSTHCLVFREDVTLEWDFHGLTPNINATNIPVRSRIATVI